MNIYRIVRKKFPVYDDFHAITVRASNPEEARKVAVEFIEREAKAYLSERFDRIWGDVFETDVHLIDLKEEPQVIATEFRHG
jgi:hypothetical protein